MAEHLRRVIREHGFERELRALIADAIAADQFVEAAEFLLVRDPGIGSQIAPHSSVWFLPMAPIEGGVDLALLHIRRFNRVATVDRTDRSGLENVAVSISSLPSSLIACLRSAY